jgi:hypothetical protein
MKVLNLIVTFVLSIMINCANLRGNGVDPNDVPIVHIHMDDHDGDPLNFHRFDKDRRDAQSRLSQLELTYNGDKRALMDLISHQTAKVAELTNIAESTNRLLKSLIMKNVDKIIN